ncbi:acetyl-CoA acetyltransferase [Mycobacterium tuberculosis CAS/NITR204]|uniref:Acetyl-CoA acetyltransferase n=1 Tax=Mycobacterium tuberculosis CAS/NITR204 TaxID=1310114 RepID=R4MEB3_MYCTX|nr:acetyl-CoA acetyltransferase [Mycobacterium tuberculosis CAS/NITR204]
MLIGYGQVNHRGDIDAEKQSIEPVDLMAAAARKAADSTVLEAVDSIRVVHMLSAHYRNPGQLLGERIKARTFTTGYSGVGGNMPQSLVNRACLDIQQRVPAWCCWLAPKPGAPERACAPRAANWSGLCRTNPFRCRTWPATTSDGRCG